MEQTKKRIRDRSDLKLIIPQYVGGYDIEFCDDDNHICGRGRITKVTKPGERGNELSLFHDEMIEVKYEIDIIVTM